MKVAKARRPPSGLNQRAELELRISSAEKNLNIKSDFFYDNIGREN